MQTSGSIKDDLFSGVPENIHTPALPHGGQRNFEGRRVQKEAISEGVGGRLKSFFFSGSLGKIGKLFINTSFSVEQAISYFTVIYRCFKTSIIVCLDHLLSTVG